jgi:AcrR family transcriptional regulator
LEGLRLRDVAAEVGIDHSTIHHYFPTKALVTAVVDYASPQFWTAEPRAEDAGDELRRQLTRLARMIVERPELHIVVRELDLRARREPGPGTRRRRAAPARATAHRGLITMHVLIIGGGIGGLCLAQGLRRRGVSVAVYERDGTPDARLQGYRLSIEPPAARAARLPAA